MRLGLSFYKSKKKRKKNHNQCSWLLMKANNGLLKDNVSRHINLRLLQKNVYIWCEECVNCARSYRTVCV